MGLSGISIGQLLLILVIVLLIFGGKRLGSLGSDIGNALKSFRKAMQEEDTSSTTKTSKLEELDHKNSSNQEK